MTDHLETLKVALDFVNSQPCRCMSIAQLGERDYCDRCSAIRAIKQADAAIALMRGQSEVVEFVDAVKSVRSTLARNRQFGDDTFGSWRRAACSAEGDLEEALALLPAPPKDPADEQ